MSEYKKDELGTAAIKRVVELEAKNGELDKKLEAVEMVHSNYVNVSCDLYSTLEKKLEIAIAELGAHCAWENTKEDCGCSACESIKKIKGASNE